jgi:polyhydroxybutyrate depolymerase
MQAAPARELLDTERKLTVAGLQRSFRLYIPAVVDRAQPAPLVFAFHGAGSDPTDMESSSGLEKVADTAGFILVYPLGVGQSWNAGTCCDDAVQQNIDEAAFVRQILTDLQTVAKIDPKRIYATGFSNGAGLVYRLGCEMSETFAAVAPVAGSLLIESCQPLQPVSLIDIHGKKDTTAPYEGGGSLNLLPMQELIQNWAQLDECTDSPMVEKEKVFTHTSYTTCKAGSAVEHYAIEEGGHSWPTKSLWDASQAIWDFFAAHPKQ